MKRVLIVACGSYVEKGFGCPGDYKCFKALNNKEGEFKNYDEDVSIEGFLQCKCNGRQLIPNIGSVKNNTDIDVVHLSTCMVNSWPPCPNMDVDELAKRIEEKYNVKVVKGTHNY